MFIVWGKKYVYRKLGYVADFCSQISQRSGLTVWHWNRKFSKVHCSCGQLLAASATQSTIGRQGYPLKQT